MTIECWICGRGPEEVDLRMVHDGCGGFTSPEYVCEEDWHNPDDGPCWDELGPVVKSEVDHKVDFHYDRIGRD